MMELEIAEAAVNVCSTSTFYLTYYAGSQGMELFWYLSLSREQNISSLKFFTIWSYLPTITF